MTNFTLALEIKNAIANGKSITGLAKNIAHQMKVIDKCSDKEIEEFLKECGIAN